MGFFRSPGREIHRGGAEFAERFREREREREEVIWGGMLLL
jgi:hypothetical protein